MKKLLSAALLLSISACSEVSFDDHFIAAKNHIEQQNTDAAIIELKNAVRIDPANGEARFLLGSLYLASYQLENAEKELERALENGYDATKVVPLLSKTYQKTGANNALIKLSLKKAGLTPTQAAQVKFYKLEALIKEQQEEKARKIIDEIKALPTKSAFKPLALVYALFLDQQNEAAVLQLDQVLADYPTQPDALKLKANILVQERKLQQAIDIYRRYVNEYPEELEMSFVFARLLTDASQTEEAEPIVDKLLTINDKNALLNQLKSIARYQAGDHENALSYAEKSLQDAPESTAVRLIAGLSAYLLEDYEKTHQHLSFIADQLPADHQALRVLAASQLNLGLSLEANETLGQLENVGENDSTLFSSVGMALAKEGEIVKAKTVLEQSASKANTSQELARLGMLQLSLNDVEGIISLEKALAKTAQQEQEVQAQQPIERVLATAYISTGQLDKALNLAKQWKTKDAKSIKGYMLAGLTQTAAKSFDDAAQEFQQALALEPQNAQIRMAIIQLELKRAADNEAMLDQAKQKALADIYQLLAESPDHLPAISTAYLLEKTQQLPIDIIKHAEQQLNLANDDAAKKAALTMVLAKIQFSEQNFEQVISLLSPYEGQAQLADNYWLLLGQSYIRSKQFTKATKHYQEWLAAIPNSRPAVLGNVMLLEGQRKYQQAYELVDKFAGISGDDPQLDLILTHMALMTGQVAIAQQHYDSLPKQALEFPVTKGLLGQLQFNKKDFANALSNLTTAYQHKAQSRLASLIYLSHRNLGQEAQGYAFINAHVQAYPRDLETLMLLAQLQIPKSYELAIKTYEQALTVNEGNSVAHNNVAFLYMESKQLDKAKQHAEKALALQPENIDVLDTLGKILLLQGDAKTALKHLSNAVSVSNDQVSEEIYLNYIEALLANDQQTLAKRKIDDRKLSAQGQEKAKQLLADYAS